MIFSVEGKYSIIGYNNKRNLEVETMIGQTNLFDDILETEERFVIVVQSLEDRHNRLIKRTLREYSSLDHSQMESLLTILKIYFSRKISKKINLHFLLQSTQI